MDRKKIASKPKNCEECDRETSALTYYKKAWVCPKCLNSEYEVPTVVDHLYSGVGPEW